MSREEMLKVNWKAYMEIHYKHPRMNEPLLCLLVEIDFDEESLTLQPLFGEDYINKDFYAGIQFCSIPTRKMKTAVLHGKKVDNKKSLPAYQGSMDHINPYFKYENLDLPDAS